MITAILFLGTSSLLGFSVLKIWQSLKLIPQLQRNQRIMWLHLTVIVLYSVFFVSMALIVSMAMGGSF
jgi:hypothetical protein